MLTSERYRKGDVVMNVRKWLSALLTAALLLTLLQAGGARIYAEEGESFTSNALTINGEAVTWQLIGERPSTFGDQNSPARLEYYSDSSLQFELQAVQSNVPEGQYELSLEVFSEQASPGPDALFYAITSEGTYSTPIQYSGSSWEAPATLRLGNVSVGSDGSLLIGVKMNSSGEHYGYIRNIQLKAGKTTETVAVKPNSAILRPGYSVALTTAITEQQSIQYASSNESVAVVDAQGIVTAAGDGEATITATVYEQGEIVAVGSSEMVVSSTMQQQYTPIAVEPVDELIGASRSDFIMGADISMMDALAAIDRKFYSADGVESSLISELKNGGVNWVRLRAWVDPSDEQGRPYGAGNIDTDALVRMAAQAKAADMKLLVDLHYSDFWTDPGRQSIPKSWAALNEEELKKQVYDYTYETLQALVDAQAYPDMIQIGNEINGGMLWPLGNSPEKAKPYLEQGIKAVRDFEAAVNGDHIDIVIHRANPGDGLSRVSSFYATYSDLDYDVIGLSYYPFWHGTLNNLQLVMDELAATYNKKIAIVETSYAYTLEDTILNGPTGHIFGQSQADAGGYLATVQGQASAIRDVIAAVAAVPQQKGIGIFYWEPGWQMGTDTGWATTYAASYQKEAIPADGGSGWANQALFNYFGEALPSIKVFSAVRASREQYVEPTIVSVASVQLTTSQDDYAALPSTVKALFSDDTYREVEVLSWTPSSYDVKTPGNYELVGALSGGQTVTASITVRPKNYVVNPGLESPDMSAWELTNSTRSTDAAYSGSYAIHFWNQETVSAKQLIQNLPNGVYELSVQTRIGIEGEPIAETSMLYATTGNKTYSAPLEVTGWDRWKKIMVSDIEVRNGQLEVGVQVHHAEGDYGDFDDWELIRVGDLPGSTPRPNPPFVPSPTETTEQVLSSSQENGITVLKAEIPANQSELVIPAKELANHAGARIVLTWGEQIVSFDRDAVAEQLKDDITSSTSNIVVRRSANEQLELGFNGAEVNALLVPVQWNVIEKAASDQRDLDVQLQLTAKTTSSVSGSSSGLYRVAADGKLTYVRDVTLNDSGIAELQLQAGLWYTVADVTRKFTDVDEQSEAIRKLVAIGLVQGDQRGALHVQQQATRAEVSKLTAMLVELIGDVSQAAETIDGEASMEQAADNSAVKSFADVPTQHWAKPYIEQLTARGWLIGVSENNFAPNAAMSYEALCVMLARILNLPLGEVNAQSSIEAHAWAQPSIEAIASAGVLTQAELLETDFTAPLTREQLFEVFYRLLEYIEI